MGSKPKTPKLAPVPPPPPEPLTEDDASATAAEDMRKKNKKRRGRGANILSGMGSNDSGNSILGG